MKTPLLTFNTVTRNGTRYEVTDALPALIERINARGQLSGGVPIANKIRLNENGRISTVASGDVVGHVLDVELVEDEHGIRLMGEVVLNAVGATMRLDLQTDICPAAIISSRLVDRVRIKALKEVPYFSVWGSPTLRR
jgi:hypothetical protein